MVWRTSYIINALSLILLFFTPTNAVPGRTFQGCGLAKGSIYCLGGYTGFISNTHVYKPPISDFINIDLTKFDFTSVNSTIDYWSVVPTPNDFALEPVAGSIATTISNKTKLFFTGGYGDQNSGLTNSTTIYDPSDNTWTAVPNTLSYYASSGQAVELNDTHIFNWGGLSNITKVNTVPNQINYLNYATLQWSSIEFTGLVAFDYTATLVPGGRIYIIGGGQGSPSNSSQYYNSMTVVTWYDTVSSSWGSDHATGTNVVPRKYHTADLIPGTTKILIYGGIQTTKSSVMPVSDVCYIYDYKAMVYTPISFKSTGAGPRGGHSSVLYQMPSTNKVYLFILFGYDSNVNFRNDTWALNLTNANSPTWLIANSNESSDESSSSDALSTGAIIGISIGSAVAGIGLTAFAVIWFLRKRKQRQEFEIEQMDPRQHQFADGDQLDYSHGDDGIGETLSTSQSVTGVATEPNYVQSAKIELASEDGMRNSHHSDSTDGPLLNATTKPHGLE